MPPKKNNNNETNASLSQNKTSSDAVQGNTNRQPNDNNGSQGIGGVATHSKPIRRSKRAVSQICSYPFFPK
jgi:hypothetical protein